MFTSLFLFYRINLQNNLTFYKMRKSLISLTTFILLVTIFVSCSKEETKETPPPTISFLTGIHPGSGLPYITKDTSLVKGTKFAFGIAASTGSGDNLKRLLVKGNFENVSYRTLIDTTFDSPSITYDSTNFAYTGTPGNEDFEFTVWDKNDQSATIGFRSQLNRNLQVLKSMKE